MMTAVAIMTDTKNDDDHDIYDNDYDNVEILIYENVVYIGLGWKDGVTCPRKWGKVSEDGGPI